MKRTAFIGWDTREGNAFTVARRSLRRHISKERVWMNWISLGSLQHQGLYTRPIEHREGPTGNTIMWDVISDAPMSTEHACARFLVKELAQTGWALFTDGDVLFRADVNELFDQLDSVKALYCVHHRGQQASGVKMDGQVQTQYGRKNWSSVFAINCDHPANAALTVELINTIPGRDLHRFIWLDDSEIGELGVEWNYLIGESQECAEPKICHFTLGVPDMPGYEDVPYATEWRAELLRED